MRTLSQSGGTSRGLAGRIAGSGEGFDSVFVERVRLYLRVTFLINCCFAAESAGVQLSGADQSIGAGAARDLIIIVTVTVAEHVR